VVDFGFGFGEGFCAELADGVLKRKRRAEGFCRGIVSWGCGGTRRARGDATVAREWGRIAETRWRGVTGSGRLWDKSRSRLGWLEGFGTWGGKLSVCIVFATIVEYSCSVYLSKHVAVYQCSIGSMKHAKLLSGQLGCAVAVSQHEIQLSNLGDMQTRRGDDM
jgi:hypothetical protein